MCPRHLQSDCVLSAAPFSHSVVFSLRSGVGVCVCVARPGTEKALIFNFILLFCQLLTFVSLPIYLSLWLSITPCFHFHVVSPRKPLSIKAYSFFFPSSHLFITFYVVLTKRSTWLFLLDWCDRSCSKMFTLNLYLWHKIGSLNSVFNSIAGLWGKH